MMFDRPTKRSRKERLSEQLADCDVFQAQNSRSGNGLVFRQRGMLYGGLAGWQAPGSLLSPQGRECSHAPAQR